MRGVPSPGRPFCLLPHFVADGSMDAGVALNGLRENPVTICIAGGYVLTNISAALPGIAET